MRAAQPAERDVMLPRAITILDKVAFEIESQPNPALRWLLAEVRGEVRAERD
jgi:hypothetical protein